VSKFRCAWRHGKSHRVREGGREKESSLSSRRYKGIKRAVVVGVVVVVVYFHKQSLNKCEERETIRMVLSFGRARLFFFFYLSKPRGEIDECCPTSLMKQASKHLSEPV
jgi:hypothetical protein